MPTVPKLFTLYYFVPHMSQMCPWHVPVRKINKSNGHATCIVAFVFWHVPRVSVSVSDTDTENYYAYRCFMGLGTFLSLISIMDPTRVIANVTLPSASSYGITLRSWIHDQYQKSKQLVDPKN